MNRRRRALCLLLFVCLGVAGAQPKSPEETFGFKMGADHKLVKWPQIVEYFHTLGASSNKVKIIEAGKTSEGNPMIVAIISSPENLARLDHYKDVSRRLANPRGLSPDDATRLIADGKLIITVSCSIHASEVAATQLSMELAYDLVTKDTPEIRRILDQDIILLWPSHNPDGNITVVDWYNRNVGTKYEDAPLPWLYHKYVGHDNNRDWFMLNLDETKVVTKFYFKEWFPQVHYDIHQMGRTGARLFVPPFLDPLNPNIHPLIWRGINLLGTHMAEAEEEAGHTGVAQNILYTSWWQGNSLQQPWFHNMVSVSNGSGFAQRGFSGNAKSERTDGQYTRTSGQTHCARISRTRGPAVSGVCAMWSSTSTRRRCQSSTPRRGIASTSCRTSTRWAGMRSNEEKPKRRTRTWSQPISAIPTPQ